MRQQINLYQPIFSEARKPFSALSAALAFAIVVIALAGFSVHANRGVTRLAGEVEVLREQQRAQEALLEQTGQSQAAQETPEQVEARIKKLTASLNNRHRALKILQSGGASATAGFAARMEALARRHVDGLWIDTMTLSGADGAMSLGGATLNPDIVPAYLKSLAQEPVFAGTRFDEFMIEGPSAATRVDASETHEDANPAKRASPQQIRFRAGNRSVTLPTVEAAT